MQRGELRGLADESETACQKHRSTNCGTHALTLGGRSTPEDPDYEVHEGSLGSFASHAPVLCSTGQRKDATITPAAANSYYLVVPTGLSVEGSYEAPHGVDVMSGIHHDRARGEVPPSWRAHRNSCARGPAEAARADKRTQIAKALAMQAPYRLSETFPRPSSSEG